jgi:hypothetical protein
MKSKKKPAKVTNARLADESNAVITVEGGEGLYRREPCPDCPWRKDAVGKFPAEAFRISAPTAYDMADHTFGCHSSGSKKPATCAGGILGQPHNFNLRMGWVQGKYRDVTDGGHELFETYREMAIANGVDPEDPVLAPCR